MLLKYKYKLKPHKSQAVIIANWLELARKQYNYRLAERFSWFEATRTPVNACPLNVSVVPVERIYQNIPEFRTQTRDGRKKDGNGNPITKKGDKHSNIINGYVAWETVQLADLGKTKKLFPEYKSIHSQVLQDIIHRVQTTMDNFIKPDKNGKTSGRPKFKGKHYYNSFSYPQLSNANILKNANGRYCVNLPKIGLVPLVYNRSIPEGFKVKTGTVIRAADGYYISFTIENRTVPLRHAEIQPTLENSKGIDLGLLYYAVTSDGEFIETPKFFRKSENRLSKLQVRLAKKSKYSQAWKILKDKIAGLHQLIARQRLDWQFKLAYHLFSDTSVIFLEDLQIASLVRRCQAKLGENGQFLPNGQSAKSGLNKSLQDAAFGQFIQVLEYVAWKLGKKIIKVDPKGTSQHCWECLNKVPKSWSERFAPRHERHSCPKCGQELDRDYNSALLIQKIGLLSTQGEDITSVKTAVKASLTEESRAFP
ncbi:RNA-guided endonuclease TnpB family protein [Okeania sp. KiyG1]|uniref:RNA-guided endonuclease InsQ/TnpB family protein n=1 Tax=Okeania sp. KiyG1 TaxID=2720165 RepID=UPI001922E591|nr:RNA-guided endonuclease TnpB family protein [Okeania sp. KiyG1]GGA55007.1 transposase [Okeania sp. KiyG1]